MTHIQECGTVVGATPGAASEAPAPADTKPRRHYAKGAAKRELILSKALEAFGQSGFHGATIRDIAARCDISHQSLLHYFHSKEELLLAVLRKRDERLSQFFDRPEGLPPEEMIAFARDNLANPGHIELYSMAAAEAADPNHPAHAYYAEYNRNIIEALARYFSINADVTLRPGVTPDVAARLLLGVQDGLQLQWLYEPREPSTPEVMRRVLSLITR